MVHPYNSQYKQINYDADNIDNNKYKKNKYNNYI